MKDDFLYKYYNDKYISNALYQKVLFNYKSIIPKDFNIDKYNDEILDKMYRKYKNYFDNMFNEIDSNIHIDSEQARAVLADEDYSLIIAGAGTGKTTTMVAKVKYLVDKLGVNPSDIVVISFTKKTTEELAKRIIDDFDIAANVFTFHSLGYKYIRNFKKDKKNIHIVDDNEKNSIFFDYMKNKIFNNKEQLKNLVEIYKNGLDDKAWILGNFLANNYEKYNSFDEYFEDYKKDCIWKTSNVSEKVRSIKEKRINEDSPRTLKGELVKSVGEAKIANFLYENGIDYKYEKVYKEMIDDEKEYKPDFTINYAGDEIYIEYFGLSNYADNEIRTYEKIKKMKIDYHARKHTNFIKIDYYPGEDIILTLKTELDKYGVKLNPKSDYAIYDEILDQNPTSEMYNLKNFWFDVIDTIKSSVNREHKNEIIDDYLKKVDANTRLEYESNSYFLLDFYDYYNEKLTSDIEIFKIDFNDMIFYANKFLAENDENAPFNYKYLIIDEYQDISLGRYMFTKEIIKKNHGKIVAVGDDWQSIYGFSGSKIEYVYNFDKYYRGAKLFKINTTYRNSQTLIDYAGKFIMRNPSQIKKELVSIKDEEDPIQIVKYDKYEEYNKLKEVIFDIHKNNPDHSILILARKNYTIDSIFKDNSFIDSVGTKIKIKGINDINIDGMSIHRSKGLTTDDVIIIGLNNHFPVEGYGHYWLKELFKNKQIQEKIDDAEERRVFYVALTRAKHKVYLLISNNNNYVSPFVTELQEIIKSKES